MNFFATNSLLVMFSGSYRMLHSYNRAYKFVIARLFTAASMSAAVIVPRINISKHYEYFRFSRASI
jgi:hypothetical protein